MLAQATKSVPTVGCGRGVLERENRRDSTWRSVLTPVEVTCEICLFQENSVICCRCYTRLTRFVELRAVIAHQSMGTDTLARAIHVPHKGPVKTLGGKGATVQLCITAEQRKHSRINVARHNMNECDFSRIYIASFDEG